MKVDSIHLCEYENLTLRTAVHMSMTERNSKKYATTTVQIEEKNPFQP